MSDTTEDRKKSVISIDRETLVPIGLLVSVVLTAVGSVLWLGTQFSDLAAVQQAAAFDRERGMLQLRNEIAILSGDIKALQVQVQNTQDDRWRYHDMKAWVEILKAKNPALDIPEPLRSK